MDIALKGPELEEALRLYLESRGLAVQGDTEVVVRNDDNGELTVEIKGVSLGESRGVPRGAPQSYEVAEEPVRAPQPRAARSAPTTPRMASMPDASSWENGQLEPTRIVNIPADRFRVDPVPPGEAPTARALARPTARIIPVHDNEGVAEEYQTHPVEGLLSNAAVGSVPGERGSMAAMPDDF